MRTHFSNCSRFYCVAFLLVGFLSLSPQTGDAGPTKTMHEKIPIPVRKQIVGTWKLISVEGTGFTIERLGKIPVGILTYDESGFVTAQIMRTDRSKFASDDVQLSTLKEVDRAFKGYVAYFGTYEVDELERSVTHHVKGNLFPNDVGKSFKRYCEFSGNRMSLRVDSLFAGDRVKATLVWERA